MTEEEIRINKLIKSLNGLEVTWIGRKGVRLPAIILADIEKGISVKALSSPEEQREKFLEAGWNSEEESISLKTLRDPKDCLASLRKEFIVIYEELLNNTIEERIYDGTIGGNNPVCLF